MSVPVPSRATVFADLIAVLREHLELDDDTPLNVSAVGGAKWTLLTRPTLAPLIQTSVPPRTFRALPNAA